MATLRPLATRSRNCAAVNAPPSAWAATSATMVVISRTRRPQEEMIVRHFVGPAHPSGQLEQPPDVAFLPPRRLRDVAHSRRPEPLRAAQQRRDDAPGGLVLGVEARGMAGQANEGAVQNQFAAAGRLLQGDDEDRRRQPWLQHEPQLFPANALLVRVFGVIGGELLQEA